MFLFCGVFYPVETLPGPLLALAWALPLTSVNSLVRTLTLDFPFQPGALAILGAWLAVVVFYSRRASGRSKRHFGKRRTAKARTCRADGCLFRAGAS
jgi:ABC-type polysaccharide/polyol phosphate export permease